MANQMQTAFFSRSSSNMAALMTYLRGHSELKKKIENLRELSFRLLGNRARHGRTHSSDNNGVYLTSTLTPECFYGSGNADD